jgi:monofunctional biosynthetic peptidoglycan transglycosylase
MTARTGLGRRLARGAVRLAGAFALATVGVVALYRFVDPPLTPLMVIRAVEGRLAGRPVGIDRCWVDLDAVSPVLVRSVLAAEDARFFEHGAVDLDAVERARKFNRRQRGGRLQGASTITMQCARNVFLWPDRTWLRKGLEVYFASLLEVVWGKPRILEVYLNVIEWGPGIYGVEAAAQRWFHVPAARLDARQAALLAAVLPAPRRRSPAAPSAWVERYAGVIRTRAARLRLPEAR